MASHVSPCANLDADADADAGEPELSPGFTCPYLVRASLSYRRP